MKLFDIAKTVLKEDTWGNNPSAAAPQNPGTSPTAASPAPEENTYDANKDLTAYTSAIEQAEENAKKELNGTLGKALQGKKVTARAGKGTAGQVEKDYSFTVVGVDITYFNDAYVIILKGDDKKDYYINPSRPIKVEGQADATDKKAPATQAQAPKPTSNIAQQKPANPQATSGV